MTVDHLKMLHTAGGKGKVPCLTVGQQPCGEAAERGVRSLALSVQRAVGVLGESGWNSPMFCQEFGTFLLLEKICGVASTETFYSAGSRSFEGRAITSLSSHMSAL